MVDDQDFSYDLLKSGEVAVAITAQPGPLQGCDSLALGTLRYSATASPAHVARWFPHSVTPQALTVTPALRFNEKERLQTQRAARQGHAAPLPSHRIASSHGFIDACRAGLGWGMNPDLLTKPHLASGAPVRLTPAMPLHWQFARLTAPALARLTRAL